eukprot:gene20233-22210_t
MQTEDLSSKSSLSSIEDPLPLLPQDDTNNHRSLVDGAKDYLNLPEIGAASLARSPEFLQQQECTWGEGLSLPMDNLERNDIIQEYEQIGREEIHGINDSPVTYLKDHFDGDTSPNLKAIAQRSKTDEGNQEETISKDQINSNECLEWPIIQHVSTFNEISDVLLDSYRLNKETNFLLKMLDDTNNPQSVVVRVENEGQPINSTQGTEGFENNSFHNGNYPSASPCSIVNTTNNNNNSLLLDCNVNEAEMSKTMELHENLEYVVNMDRICKVTGINSNLQTGLKCHKTIYEAKEEKYVKRKEKNRECSRLFRFKQRLKEDALKKGKCEKEMHLRRLIYERERLKSAMIELTRSCTSCSKAMQILSDSPKCMNNKENMCLHE